MHHRPGAGRCSPRASTTHLRAITFIACVFNVDASVVNTRTSTLNVDAGAMMSRVSVVISEARALIAPAVKSTSRHRVINAAAGMDALIAARRGMHGVILGVKNEAKAYYGPSSDQIAALGLKKKSERSRSGRGKKGTEGA